MLLLKNFIRIISNARRIIDTNVRVISMFADETAKVVERVRSILGNLDGILRQIVVCEGLVRQANLTLTARPTDVQIPPIIIMRVTRTSEMLNHCPHATVRQNATIFKRLTLR